MPPHTRSQRRRQNARHQPRQNVGAERIGSAPRLDVPAKLEGPPSEVPVMPEARPIVAVRGAAQPGTRRVLTRPAPEPIDYTKDYVAARLDLRRIALWALLLFVAMIVLKFSGLV